MGKRSIRGWEKKIFSLVLALAIILEPPMISIAANEQAVSEENSAEESKTAEGVEAGEGSEAEEESEPTEGSEAEEESEPEEESGPAEGSEPAEEEETAETEEESSEEAEEPKLTTEDSIAGDLVNAASTEADFVVTGGVLTSYTGTATEVIIPGGVTEIAKRVFENNTTIESVTCPNSLKSIGEEAFNGCTGLREVTLNEGLTTIGNFAFQCVGFGGKTSTQAIEYGKLTIPSTVSEIGTYAFKESAYLGEVIFKNGDTQSISYPRSSCLDHRDVLLFCM